MDYDAISLQLYIWHHIAAILLYYFLRKVAGLVFDDWASCFFPYSARCFSFNLSMNAEDEEERGAVVSGADTAAVVVVLMIRSNTITVSRWSDPGNNTNPFAAVNFHRCESSNALQFTQAKQSPPYDINNIDTLTEHLSARHRIHTRCKLVAASLRKKQQEDYTVILFYFISLFCQSDLPWEASMVSK